MSDNYQPMWTLVDNFRRIADELDSRDPEIGRLYTVMAQELEDDIRTGTGDLPVRDEEPQVDLIDTPTDELIDSYVNVIRALEDAAPILERIADRSGHTIRIADATQARVIGRRCYYALRALQRIGKTPQVAK